MIRKGKYLEGLYLNISGSITEFRFGLLSLFWLQINKIFLFVMCPLTSFVSNIFIAPTPLFIDSFASSIKKATALSPKESNFLNIETSPYIHLITN